MGAIRVLDRKRVARIAAGAAVILVMAGLGTLTWDGPMGTLLRYSLAPSCPADAPSPDCIATLPATVTMTWNDFGEGEPYETLLGLDVPGAPAGTTRNPYEGTIDTWLTLTDAERLRVAEYAVDPADLVDRVEVTMFDGAVVTVTGADGETARTRYGLLPRLAAGEFLLMVLVASAFLASAVALWRRLGVWRGRTAPAGRGSPPWLGRAIATATVGTVAGALTTVITNSHVAEGWTIPILGAATLVVAAPVAFLFAQRLREPFAAQLTENHGNRTRSKAG